MLGAASRLSSCRCLFRREELASDSNGMIGPEHGILGWRYWLARLIWPDGRKERGMEPTCPVSAPPADPLDRIRRALIALNTAPDVDPAKATRAEVAALHEANLAAWMVLTEGDVPPSRRNSTP